MAAVQDAVRGALAVLQGVFADGNVAVIYKGTEVTGLRDVQNQVSGVGALGDLGTTGARVFVSTATIDEPARGDPIMIGGKACFVASVKSEPADALYEIEYTETQPIGD